MGEFSGGLARGAVRGAQLMFFKRRLDQEKERIKQLETIRKGQAAQLEFEVEQMRSQAGAAAKAALGIEALGQPRTVSNITGTGLPEEVVGEPIPGVPEGGIPPGPLPSGPLVPQPAGRTRQVPPQIDPQFAQAAANAVRAGNSGLASTLIQAALSPAIRGRVDSEISAANRKLNLAIKAVGLDPDAELSAQQSDLVLTRLERQGGLIGAQIEEAKRRFPKDRAKQYQELVKLVKELSPVTLLEFLFKERVGVRSTGGAESERKVREKFGIAERAP